MSKPAARIGDMHTCPIFDGATAHAGGAITIGGSPNVLIGSQPAATQGSVCQCVSPAINVVQSGSNSVLINGKPAARQGDPTAHGGLISMGFSQVLIGD
jgi:uncharacterized Zn-binding protein involved in type VI secretion